MNKRGQLGPQGLEDLPMAVLALIVGVAVLVVFFSIVTSRLTEVEVNDMHATGKRLVEELSSDLFESNESRSYGDSVLDGAMLDETHDMNPALDGLIGSIEYGFWAEISIGIKEWAFGAAPPETALAYGGAITVLSDSLLYDGEVVVKIWLK